MITLREFTTDDKGQIEPIAVLHKSAFPDFFLTQLGIPFLKTLYRGYLEDDCSGIIAAMQGDSLVGFLAYSNDYPRFFKNLIKRYLLKFAFCSLGAAIRHPSFVRPLFGAFKKSEEVTKDDAYVELSSICVDPELARSGIGTELIDCLKHKVDFNTFTYISLETDASNNEPANCFYKKNGFVLARQYRTSGGRLMNEYHFSQNLEDGGRRCEC